MMVRILILGILLITMTMCQQKQSQKQPQQSHKTLDIQGHRGCRGLLPENTLPAFQKALELGVNTLELDLAVSKDKHLVVSHEPYFRSGLSIDPSGNPVTKDDELNHLIYQMPYDEVKSYDVGTLPDERFSERENFKTFKPLLSEVVNKAEHYVFAFGKKLPDFNIEIKRSPKHDGIYHPPVKEFVELVLREVGDMNIFDNTVIQSFDLEALQIVKLQEPNIRIALLIENEKSIETNLQELGFKPNIYSCYYKLLSKEDIAYCHEKEIMVIPWTVNSIEDIQAMLDLGVDGIISDYPDRVINLVRE